MSRIKRLLGSIPRLPDESDDEFLERAQRVMDERDALGRRKRPKQWGHTVSLKLTTCARLWVSTARLGLPRDASPNDIVTALLDVLDSKR